jgi:RNA polymerase primary sigma factor
LSSEEELELAIKIQNGDKKAEDKLICANLLYVLKVALKFKNQKYLSIEELVSAGNNGIVKAAKKFDPKFKFKFITFASIIFLFSIENVIEYL